MTHTHTALVQQVIHHLSILCTCIAPAVHRRPRPRAVGVQLQSLSVGSVVHDLLRSCDLSHQINDSVRAKLTKIKTSDQTNTWGNRDAYWRVSYPDWEFAFSKSTTRTRCGPVSLDYWLQQSLSVARKQLSASQPVREENLRSLQAQCARFGLHRIDFDPEWTAETLRGHLNSLWRLLQWEESAMVGQSGRGSVLDGAEVVLGGRSEVDVCGRVHLDCEHTVQQWSQVQVLCGIQALWHCLIQALWHCLIQALCGIA